MKDKYSKTQYEEALSLYKQGLSFYRISKLTGINKGTIRDWCKRGKRPMSVWSPEELTMWHDRILTDTTRAKISASKIGELNPMWKGENVTPTSARARARRRYAAPTGTEIHHIDGDPYNNEEENIAFVSRRKHMEGDGRMTNLKQAGKEWSCDETTLLNKHYPDMDKLMILVRRSYSAIKKKAWELGLTTPPSKRPRDCKGRFL